MANNVLVNLSEIGTEIVEEVVCVLVQAQLVHDSHLEVAIVELVHKRVPQPKTAQKRQNLPAFVAVELIEPVKVTRVQAVVDQVSAYAHRNGMRTCIAHFRRVKLNCDNAGQSVKSQITS